ncbi:MAG: sulfate respiration complex iron-sulfur protein HmcB [Candidatus Methylomirabilia bacterium]
MKINRRNFLRAATVVGGSALLSRPPKAAAYETFPGWENRLGMLTDTTRCIGCRSCEAACNTVNKLKAPEKRFDDPSVFEEKRRPDGNTYTVVNRYLTGKDKKPVFRKIQCNHCNEPACANACPVGAYKKTPEGPVTYNEKVCIGCRYCMVACPFYVPGYSYDSAFEPEIRKCQMCFTRITKGGLPGCAEACPAGAITFGRRKDLLKVARERISAHPGRYVDHVYGEHEAGGTSWLYLSGVPFDQIGFQTDLPTTPYAELTYGFLSSVPLVFILWPGLLGGIHLISKSRDRAADQADKTTTEHRDSGRV